MLPLRVTALGLTGLLLAATPVTSSFSAGAAGAAGAAEPAERAAISQQAEATPAPGRTEEPSTTQAAASTARKRTGPTKPLEMQVPPSTDLTKPANGETAVRRLGADLPEVARANDMTAAGLRTMLRDDPTLWVAPTGRLFVKEQTFTEESFAAAEPAAASVPLDQTFELHSLPGSSHVIHLDFDGVDISAASAFVTAGHIPAGAYEGWDPMGDGAEFTAAERTAIQDIWARVAEDFAPFDVDVTTADPGDDALRFDGGDDTSFGTRVAVTDNLDAPEILCGSGCGGVAWIGQIDIALPVVEPAWVFASLNAQSPRAIAEAASHEAGHTFGLTHDGQGSDEYYAGSGTWAPIMGNGYYAPVTQWSNGSYDGATNSQDDLEVISAIAGFRSDEGGDSWSSPLGVTDATAFVTRSSEGDVYLVDDCTTDARAAAVAAGLAANLDVNLTLAQPSGNSALVLQTVNPLVARVDGVDEQPWYAGAIGASEATGLDASVDIPEGGPWLLEVRSGEGRTNEGGATDYSTYASLGGYTIQVEGCSTPDLAPAQPTGLLLAASGDDLVATWSAPTNDGGSPVTGYRLTLNDGSPVEVGPDVTTHTFAGAATSSATVDVRALNAIGAGSPASATRSPVTAPGQVTDVTVVTDDVTCDFGGGNTVRCIQVSWTNPASNGGSPLTRYELQVKDGDEWSALPFDFPSNNAVYERWTTKFNPVAGVRYDYRLVAINAQGEGAPYDFEALLKGPPAPITTTVTTDRDARTVKVDWQTPFDGGEPIERIHLTLASGTYAPLSAVTLPPGTTTYTFTGVKTGPKHVLIAASNLWGPVSNASGQRNSRDTSFTMPPISPDPGPIPLNTIRVTATDQTTGSLRVAWDPVVPADPVHDPILWYDVCVDVIGEIYLPGGAIFGDGTTRGTDLCHDRATVALTADATAQPFIDLTGLSIGDHYVTVTPVNPGGPAFLPSMALVDFMPTSITCPQSYTFENNQLSWRWVWSETNVNYWSVRARRSPTTAWTVVSANLPYFQTSIPITPGAWEIEVTAHLRNGRTGAPAVCSVTVPENPVVTPPTDPPPNPTPTPTPTPDPTPMPDPTVPSTPVVPVMPPTVPAPAPPPAPSPAAAPGASKAPGAKAGAKGGATTVNLTWSAPPAAGSSPVTTYEVVVYKKKGTKWVVASRKSVPVNTRALSLKLKSGSYKFAVRAKNAVGWGSPSALSKVVKPR